MSLSQNIYNSIPIFSLIPKKMTCKFKMESCLQYIKISLTHKQSGFGHMIIGITLESEWERFKEFLSLIENYIKELDDDLSNYSKFKLKMTLELNGFDEDESFYYIKILRNIFLDNRMGILDLEKPVELSNNIIALLEF